MRQFLFIVLSLLLPFHFPSHTSSLVPLCNDEDTSSLLSFKSSFSVDTSGLLFSLGESCYPKTKSWKNGTNCCLWDGVSCDTKSGHIIGLDLTCSFLQGEFHPNTSLFKLIHLQTLNLAYNDFLSSPIPSRFGDLVALTHLNLSISGFSGVIPSKISHLSKLVSLDLSYNNTWFKCEILEKLIVNATDLRELTLDYLNMSFIKPSSLSLLVKFSSSLVSLSLPGTELQGKLPNNILCLPNLRMLDLSFNDKLEGELPKLNWSTPLRYLDLSYTAFSGKVPNSINHLKSLNYLDFHYSHFEGPILLFLSNLTQLRYLDLGWNNFAGPIPQSLRNIVQLNYLDLHWNNFSDEIPSFLFNFQYLTHLDLSDNNLGGEIPDLFDKLSKLEVLDLSGNNLVGQLPASLFGLTQLSDLACSDNKLVGSIPKKISGLSNLAFLDLSGNSLNGTIPPWCFSLSSLLYLFLDGNQLTGPIGEFSSFSFQMCDFSYNKLHGNIPKSVFHLQNLSGLILSANNLSGLVVFHKFSNLQHLLFLDLSDNNFLSLSFSSGGDYTFPKLQYLHLSSCNINSFPKFLSRLEFLDTLDLSRNQIHGRIPKWFNSTGKGSLTFLDLSYNLLTSVGYLSPSWTNMEYIDLSFNKLEGDIPVPPSGIKFFSVSNNKFSGHISSDICNASSLQVLNLSHNNLTGKLPQCLGTCPSLSVFDLQKNNLGGIILSDICNASSLQVLNLSHNNLTGRLPQCLGTLPSLSVLDLQKNNLGGIIPRSYLEIETLETMNFNGNQLEGPLPWPVVRVKCKQLRVLDLGENNIADAFPSWLESLKELQVLVLRANKFNGTINCLKAKHTFPKLRIFDVSNNNFRGTLPKTCIKNFKRMLKNVNEGLQYVNATKSAYSYNDSVVVTMKNNVIELERILTTFTIIDLSSNRFEGVIPAIIGELKSLKGLNLSHNRITGSIPETIGGLVNLEWLDLSSNKLSGEIPISLTNLYSLSVLDLSQNQLVGMIPTGKQFNTFQNVSYEGNPGLCGLPLSKSCYKDEKQTRDSATFQRDEEFGFGWKPVAIGYASGGVFGILLGYSVFFIQKPQWSINFVEGILNQRARKKSYRSNANTRSHNQGR